MQINRRSGLNVRVYNNYSLVEEGCRCDDTHTHNTTFCRVKLLLL